MLDDGVSNTTARQSVHHLGFNYPFGPELTPGIIDTMITSPPKLRLETEFKP